MSGLGAAVDATFAALAIVSAPPPPWPGLAIACAHSLSTSGARGIVNNGKEVMGRECGLDCCLGEIDGAGGQIGGVDGATGDGGWMIRRARAWWKGCR